MREAGNIVVIGAGVGGLAAALRLADAGCSVTVLEAHGTPGGKMRTVPSAAGPVDAGPTVLTMRPVFESLYTRVGERLEDHLTLTPLPILARHYWDDGTCFDLSADPAESIAHVADVFGDGSADDYRAFAARARRLYDAFEGPMMLNEAPTRAALTAKVMLRPRLIADMAPHRTMAGLLKTAFRDPRLAQLFGRYATYVGGSPYASPAILSLISDAEARGVWSVAGGMHALAASLAGLAAHRGARFQYDTPVRRIVTQDGVVTGVDTDAGFIAADQVVFNGDPRALSVGLLGEGVQGAVRTDAVEPRSLSACVYAFAAAPRGVDLAHHTVFFGHDPAAEFDALARGDIPEDATLYLCAQDHGCAPDALQRFEIILNAPPVPRPEAEEQTRCQTQIFRRFADFGLTFTPTPDADALTTPMGFDRLFPASQGSLYGRSPHGMMAAFKRPTARTPIKGLYLCGGGTHPGAGVPMATLSGKHAAGAILSDRTLISTSPQTAMRGGMSTGSATVAPKPSRSSAS
ncbi:1-hydroxycarotenoid 3,4-desaturase CrtD [Cognatiyoonia koreensis]|uniref:1-hydroxycarotenoid 3,4-desaturase CrtD n=1 Tax=Cognatiyoonia koreensis TaxID=364200 RepID=UPI001F624FBF|nr:1-hydroxycarotenoid 3,4-desaturase CrtD [Cognatiyoonia koreensis]